MGNTIIYDISTSLLVFFFFGWIFNGYIVLLFSCSTVRLYILEVDFEWNDVTCNVISMAYIKSADVELANSNNNLFAVWVRLVFVIFLSPACCRNAKKCLKAIKTSKRSTHFKHLM